MRKALRQRKQVSPGVDPTEGAEAAAATNDGAAASPGSPPRRLPPIVPVTQSAQAYSAFQQASVTNATFTLSPEGKGVATFEFHSLSPLPQAGGGTAAAAAPSTPAETAEKRRQRQQKSRATPQTRKDKAKAQTNQCMKGMRTFGQTAGIIVAVTLLGNLVFSKLEAETENRTRAEYTQHMLALRDRYNMSSADFQDILERIGTPLEFDPDGEERNWGATNSNSALFVFTIVSTIGYGNFAPQTDGGKIFLMVYAALGIPIVTTCVGNLAAQFLGFVEFWAVAHMDVVETAFNFYDTDSSGHLDEEEFFRALEDLQIHLSREEVKSIIEWFDDEGARAAATLHVTSSAVQPPPPPPPLLLPLLLLPLLLLLLPPPLLLLLLLLLLLKPECA